MKFIPLTQGKFASVDDEDFDRLNKFKWKVNHIKKHNIFYASRSIRISKNQTKSILMHREILKLTDKTILVDHADRNGLNNCKSNIRIATASQNMANRIKAKNTTSKYKGMYFEASRNKWVVRPQKDGKMVFVGRFNTEIEAARAYNEAAIKLHGKFACLNIIEGI